MTLEQAADSWLARYSSSNTRRGLPLRSQGLPDLVRRGPFTTGGDVRGDRSVPRRAPVLRDQRSHPEPPVHRAAGLFAAACQLGLRDDNPLGDRPAVSSNTSATGILDPSEVTRLQAAAHVDPRTAVLVDLLLDEGMRLTEVLGLDHSDVSGPHSARRLRVVRHGHPVSITLGRAGSRSVSTLERVTRSPGPLLLGPSRGRARRRPPDPASAPTIYSSWPQRRPASGNPCRPTCCVARTSPTPTATGRHRRHPPDDGAPRRPHDAALPRAARSRFTNQPSRKELTMPLIRFDPFREFDRVFDQAMNQARQPSFPMDAYRSGDTVTVHFDLPGVDPGSIDIEYERQTLERQRERSWRPTEGDRLLAAERVHGKFQRQILLGEGLDGTPQGQLRARRPDRHDSRCRATPAREDQRRSRRLRAEVDRRQLRAGRLIGQLNGRKRPSKMGTTEEFVCNVSREADRGRDHCGTRRGLDAATAPSVSDTVSALTRRSRRGRDRSRSRELRRLERAERPARVTPRSDRAQHDVDGGEPAAGGAEAAPPHRCGCRPARRSPFGLTICGGGRPVESPAVACHRSAGSGWRSSGGDGSAAHWRPTCRAPTPSRSPYLWAGRPTSLRSPWTRAWCCPGHRQCRGLRGGDDRPKRRHVVRALRRIADARRLAPHRRRAVLTSSDADAG